MAVRSHTLKAALAFVRRPHVPKLVAAWMGAFPLVAPAPVTAQEAVERVASAARTDTIDLVDRVVAVVGDTVLLRSEVLESLVQMGAQGMEIPQPGTAAFDSLYSETAGEMVDQLIVLQKAKETDIEIPADMLDSETDRRFREVRNSFPSASAFQRAIAESGRSLVQYRQMLRAQVRARLLIDSYMQQNRDHLPPVAVTEEEIQAFFDERLEGQSRPATVSFEQLVVEPMPSEQSEETARNTALTALSEIRDGTDFEIVARRYSQGLSNRDQGGDLGWVKRSQLVPAFAQAAWAARTGEPIGPVRTRFGYHIIKVENVRGGERKVRHILIIPDMQQSDLERTGGKAETLADSIRQGRSVTELAERYGIKELPVRFPDIPMDQIEEQFGPAYAQALAQPLPGQVAGPFATAGLMPDRPVFAIVRVLEYRAQGAWELDDVREDIRRNLLYEKGYRRFLEELRNEVYVDVRL
jgi:peptidyl-prolyl cis-trans isomerase SurA